jgi:hypothetical protein
MRVAHNEQDCRVVDPPEAEVNTRPMFNTRVFVAKQFGCEPEDFTISRKPVDGYRGQEAAYTGDKGVVRVLISKPRGLVVRGPTHGQSDLHRRVVVSWPGGQTETRIEVDEEIVW